MNDDFKAATGRDYIGSRDIDVGFHVDVDWSRRELESSAFGAFLGRMEGLGFRSQSFRLYRDFEFGSLRPLSPEEAAKMPAFEVLKLYVDPVVDRVHPIAAEAFGFTPMDEPMLESAFSEGLFRVHTVGELDVRVLEPHLLLAKFNSVVTRQQGHKRVKDLADIYALIWHSGLQLSEMRDSLYEVYPAVKAKTVLDHVKADEVREVAAVLGAEFTEIRRVLRAFPK